MTKTVKYILITLIVLILGTVAVIIYRMFFEFNSAKIKEYASKEAAKYKESPEVYSLIMDGVEYILASHNLTNQF